MTFETFREIKKFKISVLTLSFFSGVYPSSPDNRPQGLYRIESTQEIHLQESPSSEPQNNFDAEWRFSNPSSWKVSPYYGYFTTEHLREVVPPYIPKIIRGIPLSLTAVILVHNMLTCTLSTALVFKDGKKRYTCFEGNLDPEKAFISFRTYCQDKVNRDHINIKTLYLKVRLPGPFLVQEIVNNTMTPGFDPFSHRLKSNAQTIAEMLHEFGLMTFDFATDYTHENLWTALFTDMEPGIFDSSDKRIISDMLAYHEYLHDFDVSYEYMSDNERASRNESPNTVVNFHPDKFLRNVREALTI